MRTIEGENELLLTCEQTPDGIAVLRCETRDDDVRLPDEIDGAPVVGVGISQDCALRPGDAAVRLTFQPRMPFYQYFFGGTKE